MRRFINKYKSKIITLVICMIFSGIISVSASYIFSSSQVSYDNSTSGMGSNNVQDAIDELYNCATDYQTFKSDILDAVYPVGSIYISKNNTNPSQTFGGTWVSYGSGKTLVGVDTNDASFDTVEETGGNKTTSYTPAGTVGNHTLTVNEIPSHKHRINEFRGTEVGYVAKNSHIGSATVRTDINGIANNGGTFTDRENGTYYSSAFIDNTGGGGAHNHGFTGTAANISTVQPYITVYMWKRTA